MPRIAALLLATASCWRSPRPPPPLRIGEGPTTTPVRMSWRGTCGDEHSGWREAIAVTLTIRNDGDQLFATGTMAFADRRTKARLQGPRSMSARHTLRGEMVEVEGSGTRWGLILEVEPTEVAIRGRFIELIDEGGEDEMCRFEWFR